MCCFGWCHRLIQRADSVAKNFIGFQAMIRIFIALDGLSSISGPKVMAKKFQIFQECPVGLVGISLTNLQYFGHDFGNRNVRKSIKPSKVSYYS